MIHDYGSLAGALAKAQAAFPPIVRDKEVAVRSYSYKYAPLDAILSAVREPLSVNGLAIAQLLDGPDLVTLLLHESGSTLSARTPLPPWEGVQQYGSMVTYIRRYALTAILGIASEDDDDGEAAAKPGKRPVTKPVTRPETPDHGGMVGFASAGKGDADMHLRMTPTGHALAFRLTENQGGRGGFKVLALNSLAEKLEEVKEQLYDQRVTVWGTFTEESFDKKQPDGTTKAIPYRVLHLQRIETPVGLFVKASDDLEPALSASLEEHVRKRVTAVTPDPDEDDEVTQSLGVWRLQDPLGREPK